METIILSGFIAAIILLVLYILCRFWQFTLGVLATVVLAVSCSKADPAIMDVAVIIESEADRASMDVAIRDAREVLSQLNLDLNVTYIEVATVAEHTHAQFLLEAVKAHRVDSAVHRLADATVLLTRRDIKMGTQDMAGIATVGPACSVSAAAIVELRDDANDGAILAHELLHTVGLPHDPTPGWLMSEGVSRYTVTTISPDSLATFRAAGAECFTTPAPNPPPVAVSAPAAPSNAGTGGGGAMDGPLFFVLLVLMVIWKQARGIIKDRNVWKFHALKRLEILERANEQLRTAFYNELSGKWHEKE